jgi:hypothetical protein
VTPADDARAFELVRVQGLSYKAAGKLLAPDGPPVPKTTIRAAVTREAVRRARTDKTGVPEVGPTADTGFMARVLADGPLPDTGCSCNRPTVCEPGEGCRAPATPPADRLFVAPPDDEDEPIDFDFGTWVRKHITKLERHIATLQAENNEGEAQKYSRTLAVYVAQLRQHEKAERADEGVMTYTLADVEAVRADLRKKVADVQHRGLVCAECGRKMRRGEAEGEDE